MVRALENTVEKTLKANGLTPSPAVIKAIVRAFTVANAGRDLRTEDAIRNNFPFADAKKITQEITAGWQKIVQETATGSASR